MTNNSSISNHLNPSQQQAVDYDGGHLLIVAGPGTGKTHTLTHRIAAQMSRLKSHQKILAVTFTQHAAREMKERLHKSVELPLAPSFVKRGEEMKMFVGTFHAFCLDVLKTRAQAAGMAKDFRIATETDVEIIAKEIWPMLSVKERGQRLKEIGRIKSRQSFPNALIGHPFSPERQSDLTTKNNGSSIKAFEDDNNKTFGDGKERLRGNDSPDSESFLQYQQALRSRKFLDYDDLLLEAVRLLTDQPEIQAQLQETYPLIFVDEYQDINPVQHQLLLKLTGRGSAVTAIGDPDQSIYGFRGSDVSLFYRFIKDFPDAHALRLTENYRSTGSLLKAAGQVIAQNDDVARQELVARFFAEGHLTIHEAWTERAEAEYVVHQIERLIGGTSLFSRDSGRVEHQNPNMAQRCFRDIAVLYRLNMQRHLLQEALDRSGIPYAVSGDSRLMDQKPVREFLDAVESLPKGEPHISEKFVFLKSSTSWHKLFEKHPQWLRTVDRLIEISRDFETVEDLRHHLALQQPQEPSEFQVDKVQLMTLHAAKGLEFPVVFIVGCERGLIPFLKDDEDRLEEERRLFYVGMTRAREELSLTHAKKRTIFGQPRVQDPSPYLRDIEDDLKRIELARSTPPRKPKKDSGQMQLDLF